MKLPFLLAFLTVVQISQAQLTNGLIAHWKFDGNTLDASGHGHHGTLAFPSNQGPDRNQDSCAIQMYDKGNVSRTGDSMVVAHSAEFHSTAITISVWCYIGDWYSLGPIKLFGKTEKDNKDFLFTVQNQLSFMGNSYGFPKVPFSKWSHFVASYNDGLYSMYVDGMPVKFGSTSKVVFSSSDISIGKYLYGYLDDIRIYNRQLNDSEVMELATLPGSCSFTTDVLEETVQPTSPIVVQAIDLQGRTIPQLEGYKGIAILIYSDGSRRKILK